MGEHSRSGSLICVGLLASKVITSKVQAILAMFDECGETDRSHRKLAQRGSYLGRAWVSASTVRRVFVPGGDKHFWPLPKPGRSAKRPLPAWAEAAYGAVVVGQVGLITALNEQIAQLQEVVVAAERFGRHPCAEIYLSQPGLGRGPRCPGARRVRRRPEAIPRRPRPEELFRAEPNPITRASGRKTVVLARYATNRRLSDVLHQQAYCALRGSPGARAWC